MRRFGALIGVVTILAFAAGPVVASGDQDRPFKATLWGDDVTFNPEIPAGRCVEMAGVADALSTFKVSGYATHLGWVEAVAEHCSDFDTGTYGDGRLTIIAANGDTLKGTYTNGESTAPPPVTGFRDDFAFIDGGTGRFAFASGGGTEVGLFDMDTFATSVYMEGVISYGRG
ncbi:MAG TPA: hypothetical protein VLA23_12130 [Candidatus Limnocylindrales bacterium]|nr:hypothetical protein [Candidatus Limnocylindrales bacterium]